MFGRSFASLCALGAALAAAPALAQTGALEMAVHSDARAASNVERDDERNPAELLAFLDLQPGDTALDWFAGGGYWTELMAEVVGEDGKVYATGLNGAGDYANVEALQMDRGAPIPLEDGSVDLILLSYVYHHMHFNADSGEATPASTLDQLAEYKRVLAPGGRVVVIEHQAADGTTREQSAAWHRMAESHAHEDFEAAGFEFAGSAPDIFSNPDDDEMNYWRDAGLAGHTTSLVHAYVKP